MWSLRLSPALKVPDSVTLFLCCKNRIYECSTGIRDICVFGVLSKSTFILPTIIILSDNSHALSKDHKQFLQNEESAFGGQYT